MPTEPEERKELDPLPGGERIVMRDPKKCKHNFIRMSGTEVECTNCHAGFFLTKGWTVKKGHIYKGKLKVL